MAIGGSSELKDSQWGIKKKRNFLKNGMLRTTKTWKSGFFSTCFSFLWVLTCWNCARHDIFESKLHVSCSVLQKGAEEVIAELQVEFEVWWHLSLLGKLAIFSWLHQRRVRLSTQFGEEWESTVIQYDWAGVHRGWHPTQLSRDDHKPRHYWIPPKKRTRKFPGKVCRPWPWLNWGRLTTCVPSLQQRTGAALKPLGRPIGDEEKQDVVCVCVCNLDITCN